MKTLGKISIGIIVFVALIALAAWYFLTPEFAGRQLAEQVRARTGRTLTMTASPQLSLWPDLSVKLRGVTLSNPPGTPKGWLLKTQEMRAAVTLSGLLRRRLEITELTLVKPRLNLLVDRRGRANWEFAGGAASMSGSGKSDPAPGGAAAAAEVTLAPITITGGDVRYLDERTGAAFAASEVDLQVLMPRLGGAIDVKGNLVWNNHGVRLRADLKSPMRLTEGGSPGSFNIASALLTSEFSGLVRLADGLSLAGTVKVETPSLRRLAAWARSPLAEGRGLEAFSLDGKLAVTGNTVELDGKTINLDGMNARGRLKLSLAGQRPLVTGSLGVRQVDVNTYLADKTAGNEAGDSGGALERGWSQETFSLAGLRALDADLSISASRVIYDKIMLDKVRLRLLLKAGRLDIDLKQAALYGGKALARLVVNGARRKPTLQLALAASGFDGYRLLKDFAGFRRIEGTAGTRLSLAAAGSSQAEMVSTLRGTTRIIFTDGAIRGVNIPAMVRGVQKNILGGWDKSGSQSTDFAELSASFVFTDGIGKTTDIRLIGPLVRLTGGGEVDMLRRRLDLKVRPKLVASLQGQGGATGLGGIAVPVIVKGPWTSPQVYPDIDGILDNPQAAFEQLSKLTGKAGNIDVKDATRTIEKKAGKTLDKVLGGDGKTKKLLDNILGSGN